MKKEIADRLSAALRSGDYEQTTEHLRDLDGFCCLGVLCDLYSKEMGIKWDDLMGVQTFLDHETELPPDVRDWAGMDSSDGAFKGGSIGPLAQLNDSGKSFKEIADIIEQKYELL